MAGIGFRLKELLQKDTFSDTLEAYLYSAIISSGPWLFSILGLVIIGFFSPLFLADQNIFIFRTLVVYTYMGTLILTGPIQMGTTRYIADRLFVNDTNALLPCFHWVGGLVLAASGIFSIFFYVFSGLTLVAGAGSVILFQAVSLCWTAMIFLSAAKDYHAIVRAFALGYCLSVVASLLGSAQAGLAGMIWGFAGGQIILTLLLCLRIRSEFATTRQAESLVKEHWKNLPCLAIIGLFYNFGIWADKLIFWFGPYGKKIHGLFYASPAYDTCIFWGYCSVVPALAVFMIRVETGFYKHYAAFYNTITSGGNLQSIQQQKVELTQSLRLSMSRLLKIQGTISLMLLLFTPWIFSQVGLGLDLVPLMRISLLAAFLQTMLLFMMILLLYFDWQKEVAIVSIIFCLSNALFTYITIFLPEIYHGIGYLFSCLLTLIISLKVMEARMSELEYETFIREPIVS